MEHCNVPIWNQSIHYDFRAIMLNVMVNHLVKKITTAPEKCHGLVQLLSKH